jgi:hypothetical protein
MQSSSRETDRTHDPIGLDGGLTTSEERGAVKVIVTFVLL